MESGKKLGENLRKWRLKKDMSQGDLATALSVDRAYISNIGERSYEPYSFDFGKDRWSVGYFQ